MMRRQEYPDDVDFTVEGLAGASDDVLDGGIGGVGIGDEGDEAHILFRGALSLLRCSLSLPLVRCGCGECGEQMAGEDLLDVVVSCRRWGRGFWRRL